MRKEQDVSGIADQRGLCAPPVPSNVRQIADNAKAVIGQSKRHHELCQRERKGFRKEVFILKYRQYGDGSCNPEGCQDICTLPSAFRMHSRRTLDLSPKVPGKQGLSCDKSQKPKITETIEKKALRKENHLSCPNRHHMENHDRKNGKQQNGINIAAKTSKPHSKKAHCSCSSQKYPSSR